MKMLGLLPEAASVAACLDAAEAAAEGLADASIDLLHVVVDPSKLVGAAEEIDMEYLRIRTEGTAEMRAEATQAALDAWIAAHPRTIVTPHWKQVVGREIDAICAEAKSYDALVVPRGINLDGAEAMHAAFYCAQKPFFLAPHNGLALEGRKLTDCIVVAWNGTPACRRAGEAARPWLRLSRQAVVMLIGSGEPSASEFAGELTKDGIPVTTKHLARDREALGDQIVMEAKVLGATLLVMGAHRHGSWAEWLLGHTTDQAVRHADIMFMMAH